jgi:acetyl-CoA carboxylase/biotin carboxylase 1
MTSETLSNGIDANSKYNHKNLPSNFIGLSTIKNAPESDVKAFVKSHGGHTVIKSVRLNNSISFFFFFFFFLLTIP